MCEERTFVCLYLLHTLHTLSFKELWPVLLKSLSQFDYFWEWDSAIHCASSAQNVVLFDVWISFLSPKTQMFWLVEFGWRPLLLSLFTLLVGHRRWCMFYVCKVIGFVDWPDRELICMWEEFRNEYLLMTWFWLSWGDPVWLTGH